LQWHPFCGVGVEAEPKDIAESGTEFSTSYTVSLLKISTGVCQSKRLKWS